MREYFSFLSHFKIEIGCGCRDVEVAAEAELFVGSGSNLKNVQKNINEMKTYCLQ